MVVMPTVAHGKVDARIAGTLEVESSATDALSVVVAMAMLPLLPPAESWKPTTGDDPTFKILLLLTVCMGANSGAGAIHSN
jgi:NhaP-type Na+/H+ or K+/H+ antiporter